MLFAAGEVDGFWVVPLMLKAAVRQVRLTAGGPDKGSPKTYNSTGAQMRATFLRKLSALAGVTVGAFVFMSGGDAVFGQGINCGMQLNQQPVIFCDTFDEPYPVTNRAGQLDGIIWGVSRLLGGSTDLTQWKDSTLDGCNGPQAASAFGATDVIVCNGTVRESTDDNHDVSVLAMYPKQPFDFANRTGTVAFDVTNDTTGTHGAWPEFWLTDKPVPAPSAHFMPCDLCSVPRHSLGIRFAANLGECPNGWRADSVFVSREWVAEDRGIFDGNTTGMQIHQKGCASLSSGPNGGLNHVEIRISQNQIDVYASDAGSRTLHLINTITNANLSFTRGLVWIQDSHYNAEKAHLQDANLPDLRIHTFTWDNVAFDGPATYRDLSFDVLDQGIPVGGGLRKTGWDTTPSSPAVLTTLPMLPANIAAASSAFLLFNFGKDTMPTVFSYTINGHPNVVPSPLPASGLIGMRTLALPVQLSDLVPGPQTIWLSSDQNISVTNVSLVLVAAAPVTARLAHPASLRITQ